MKHYSCLFLLLSGLVFGQKPANFKRIDSLINRANNVGQSNPSDAIELSQEAFKMAISAKYKEGQIKALDNLTYFYYILRKPDLSLKNAKLMETKALQFKDYIGLCNATRFKAINYSLLGFHKEASESIDKGVDYAENLRGDEHLRTRGLLFQAKTFTLNDSKKRDSKLIVTFHRKSIKEFAKIVKPLSNDISNLNGEYVNLGAEYIQLKEKDSAHYYLDKALVLSQKYPDLHSEHIVLFHLGRLSYLFKNHKEAIVVLDKSAVKSKKNGDPYTLREVYRYLDSSYLKIGDTIKAHFYLSKFSVLDDSILKVEKESLKTPFKILSKEKEETFYKEKSKLILIILCALVVLFFAIFLLYRFFKKYTEEKKENKIISQEVAEKATEVNQLALKVSESYDELIEMAKKDDPLFFNMFKQLYPNFHQKIMKIQPNLTLTEQKFCFYLILHFSTKEIAEYTFVTPKAVQNRKNRIRKRLSIPDNADIYVWISNLMNS